MRERSWLALGAVVGAAIGAGVAYLVFTERGRRLRAELQPEFEGLVREAQRLRGAVEDWRTGQAGAPRAAGSPPLAWPRRVE